MRTVGLLAIPHLRAFDYSVAAEVWGVDRHRSGLPRFEFLVVGVTRDPVPMDGVLTLSPSHTLADLDRCDLVVVPGTLRPFQPLDEAIGRALRAARARGATVVSLCAGAFVLAASGLLDGRRATTHWGLAAALAQRYPAVDVDADVLFVGSDGVWTSAGTAAGIDLCVHLVREAHGERVANMLARRLIAPPYRDGGQAQYIERPLPAADGSDSGVADAMRHGAANLHRPVSVTELARVARMSPRTFARRFLAVTGTTPMQWLLRERLSEAQRLLEATALPVERVARQCGFGSAASLRQHFARLVGTAPRDYRRVFGGRRNPGQPDGRPRLASAENAS